LVCGEITREWTLSDEVVAWLAWSWSPSQQCCISADRWSPLLTAHFHPAADRTYRPSHL